MRSVTSDTGMQVVHGMETGVVYSPLETPAAYQIYYADHYTQHYFGSEPVVFEHHPHYTLSYNTDDSVQIIGHVETPEELRELLDRHEQELRDMITEATDRVSGGTLQSADEVRGVHGIQGIEALMEDYDRLQQLQTLRSQLDGRVVELGTQTMSSTINDLVEYRVIETQRVHSLADYLPSSDTHSLSVLVTTKALVEYLNMTNPTHPPYYDGKGSCIFKWWNDKYTYVEQELNPPADKYCEATVYDQYGHYTIDEFLSMNREDAEYRDMVERIKRFYKEEE